MSSLSGKSRLLVAACLTACAFALSVSSANAAPPVNNVAPSISGSGGNYVGDSVFCDTGTWDSDSYDFTYEFKRGVTVVQAFGFNSNYTLQGADTGNSITCVVRADNGVDAPVDANSSNSLLGGGNPPSFAVTLNSDTITGNEGSAPTGATTVTVSLQRTPSNNIPITVASATTNVSLADGSWSATLTPAATSPATRTHAYALDQDIVKVQYSGPSAPADQTLSRFNQLLSVPNDVSLQSDGSAARLFLYFGGSCSDASFIKDGTPLATSGTSGSCLTTFGTPLTDNNHLQVSDTVRLSDVGGSGGGKITGIADVGLLPDSGFQFVSRPQCSGDLVDGKVTCSGLTSHTFTVTRGADVVTLTRTFDQGTASLPGGLHAGDTVQLKEQGLSRLLTTLTVDPLREDLVDGSITSGTCRAYKWLGFGDALCPSNGDLSGIGNGTSSTTSLDDTSGGSTTLDIPSFIFTSPTDGDSVSGSFVANADTVGPATQSITLTVFHRAANGSNGTQVGSALTVDPTSGVTVSGLTPGRYNAVWKLTDSHGDTSTTHSQFIEQPGGGQGPTGATGPQGSTGPQGGTGPQSSTGPQGATGPAGVGVKGVKCKASNKGKGKKKRLVITCSIVTTRAASGRATVALTRGRTVYAIGSGRFRGRRLVVRMRTTRPASRGRYSAVIAFAQAGRERRTTTRTNVR